MAKHLISHKFPTSDCKKYECCKELIRWFFSEFRSTSIIYLSIIGLLNCLPFSFEKYRGNDCNKLYNLHFFQFISRLCVRQHRHSQQFIILLLFFQLEVSIINFCSHARFRAVPAWRKKEEKLKNQLISRVSRVWKRNSYIVSRKYCKYTLGGRTNSADQHLVLILPVAIRPHLPEVLIQKALPNGFWIKYKVSFACIFTQFSGLWCLWPKGVLWKVS